MSDATRKRLQPGEPARSWRRWPIAALGCVFLALGALGVVLPGLPTTPFVLLASYCFVRSSPRLHRYLLASKAFGPVLRDWQEHRGLKRGLKLRALAACAVMVGLAVAFGGLPWPGRVAVAAAGAYGLWFVARLPEAPDAGPP